MAFTCFMVKNELVMIHFSASCAWTGKEVVMTKWMRTAVLKKVVVGLAVLASVTVASEKAFAAGADVKDVVAFAPSGDGLLLDVAAQLGLTVVIAPVAP